MFLSCGGSVMNRFLVAVGLALLLSVPQSATRADELEDCKQQEDLPRSIAGCTEIIDAKPDSQELLAVAHIFRGVAYTRTGKFDLAVADYMRVIEIDPADVDAYRERGGVYVAMGLHDKKRRVRTRHR